jgi:hypothetical protein
MTAEPWREPAREAIPDDEFGDDDDWGNLSSEDLRHLATRRRLRQSGRQA